MKSKDLLLKNDTVYPDIGMGDDFKLKLNHVRTYQIAHTVNTTETVAESSSPIAVFFSNDCNPVNWQGVCEHMFEQLPPTSGTDTA